MSQATKQPSHLFVDELEVQVAAAAVRVRLCPGLQLVPVILGAVEILGIERWSYIHSRVHK